MAMMHGMPGMMGGTTTLVTTNDPNLQCHIEGCQFTGNNICRWENCCCRSKTVGGCGKRYCKAHEYERIFIN